GGAARPAGAARLARAPRVDSARGSTSVSRLALLRAVSWSGRRRTSQRLAAACLLRDRLAAGTDHNLVRAAAAARTNRSLARCGPRVRGASVPPPPRGLARLSAAPPPPSCVRSASTAQPTHTSVSKG